MTPAESRNRCSLLDGDYVTDRAGVTVEDYDTGYDAECDEDYSRVYDVAYTRDYALKTPSVVV